MRVRLRRVPPKVRMPRLPKLNTGGVKFAMVKAGSISVPKVRIPKGVKTNAF
jgi:hypothetical protein